MFEKLDYRIEKVWDKILAFKVVHQEETIRHLYKEAPKMNYVFVASNGFQIRSHQFSKIDQRCLYIRGWDVDYDEEEAIYVFDTVEERDKYEEQARQALNEFIDNNFFAGRTAEEKEDHEKKLREKDMDLYETNFRYLRTAITELDLENRAGEGHIMLFYRPPHYDSTNRYSLTLIFSSKNNYRKMLYAMYEFQKKELENLKIMMKNERG